MVNFHQDLSSYAHYLEKRDANHSLRYNENNQLSLSACHEKQSCRLSFFFPHHSLLNCFSAKSSFFFSSFFLLLKTKVILYRYLYACYSLYNLHSIYQKSRSLFVFFSRIDFQKEFFRQITGSFLILLRDRGNENSCRTLDLHATRKHLLVINREFDCSWIC